MPEKRKAVKKQWTFMVYLAGDNSLDDAGVVDLKEMKKAGSTDKVNITAQFDRAGMNSTTKRYYLRKGGTIDQDVVESLGETNTGDPEVLKNFIAWNAKNYPAERYALVLWNHGSGWDDENVYRIARRSLKKAITRKGSHLGAGVRSPGGTVPLSMVRAVTGKRFKRALFSTTVVQAIGKKGICFDDDAKDFLDNLELKKILAYARKVLKQKIDLLGMDACLMNMVEVAFQVQNGSTVLLGSEETEPENGWPYDRVLSALIKKPAITAKDLAEAAVGKYIASYTASDQVTQSALDLGRIQAVKDAVNGLARALNDNLSSGIVKTALMAARNQVQSYANEDYIDLLDFCALLQSGADNPDIKTACGSVADAAAALVLKSAHKGSKVSNSLGVSIYFPTKEVSPLYARLDFAKKGAWDEFLNAYIAVTRRRP